MNWLRKTVSVLSASLLCGLVAPGCEENESSVFIMGVLAVETSSCVAKPERGATMRAAGTLDTALAGGSGYRAALMVGNQLTPRGSREQLRTETARVRLQGAEVTLTDSSDALLPLPINPFSTVGTGLVDPAAGTEPGLGAIFVDVIPASISQAVSNALPKRDGIVIARIRVFGTTLGNQPVESGEYVYPIHVCSGCLVAYPVGALMPTGAGQACIAEPTTTTPLDACFLGQDAPVPCTVCAGSNEVCLLPCENCAVRANPENNSLCMGSSSPTPPASCGL